jgi:hypothetical protein
MHKMTPKWLILASLMLLIGAIQLNGCATKFASSVADKIYPDLQAPYDTEAPPTSTTYPASSSIKAVLGGKGEGLGCSIPSLLEWMMFSKTPKEAPLSLQLRQACVRHDYCYRHGWATYGYQQVNCDFALQQDAYRICRLIYNDQTTSKDSTDNSHEECLSRARRVLLGVRIGGAEPFQEGAKSSYFEYDSMPSVAEDYVVTRWVEDPAFSKKSCITENCLNGSFVVFHYKRGSAVVKKMMWEGIENNSKFESPLTLFPERFIATPPNIIFDETKDQLFAVARDNFNNTVIKLVQYQVHDSNQPLFSTISKPDIDPDASLVWILPKDNSIAVSYWSHTKAGYGMYDLKNDKLIKSDILKLLPDGVHARYRTLAHRPLEGDFFEQGKSETLILKRGGFAISAKDDAGDGYKDKLHLIALKHQDKNGHPDLPVITINATEDDEPLVTIKNDDGRDLLMSMHVDEQSDDKNYVQFRIFDLLVCKNIQPSENTPCKPILTKEFKDTKNKSIDKSWVRQPVQLVFPRYTEAGDTKKSPLLFFSKIEKICKNGNACSDEKDIELNKFRYQFAYSKLETTPDGKYQISNFSRQSKCDLTIHPKQLLDSKDTLNSLIKRAKPSVLEPDDNKKYDSYSDNEKTYLTNLVNKEFFERWANAQIIPGWFFNHEGKVSIETPLDVAVIFRGYTGYSFLLSNALATDKVQLIKPFYTQKKDMSSLLDISCKPS